MVTFLTPSCVHFLCCLLTRVLVLPKDARKREISKRSKWQELQRRKHSMNFHNVTQVPSFGSDALFGVWVIAFQIFLINVSPAPPPASLQPIHALARWELTAFTPSNLRSEMFMFPITFFLLFEFKREEINYSLIIKDTLAFPKVLTTSLLL